MKGARVIAFFGNHRNAGFDICAGAAFADHDPDPEFGLTPCLRGVDDFMIVHDSGGDPGIGDLVVGHTCRVTLNHFSLFEAFLHQVEEVGVALITIQHQLRADLLDSLCFRPGERVHQLIDAGRIGRRRKADTTVLRVAHGGDDKEWLHRRAQQFVEEEAGGAQPVDDGVAVKAVDDRRRAVEQPAGGENSRIGVGVPLVTMGINQTRHKVAAVGVDHLGIVANRIVHITDSGDALALDGDIVRRLVDRAGVAIHDPTIFDDFVGWLVAHRDIDQRLALQPHLRPLIQ